jgi:glycosyltransferase involved in cell wall biosynthesis
LQKFKFSSEQRQALRRKLVVEDRSVFVYSGSIDGWYLTEEMADFFAVLLRKRPDAVLLWLTQSKHERLREMMRARGISKNDFRIVASQPADVPGYLSASDVGLSFIKPCFSKLASSPTKYAEYLGCGLPVIINAGIGDSDALVTDHQAGVLVHEFNEGEYGKAIDQLMTESNERPEERRERMRQIAEKLFDLETVGFPRYARLYEQVLG